MNALLAGLAFLASSVWGSELPVSRIPPLGGGLGQGSDGLTAIPLFGATLHVTQPQILVEEFTPGNYLWFPGAWKMPTGEILLTILNQADAFVATGFGGGSTPSTRVLRSLDGGATYSQIYTVANMVESLYPMRPQGAANLYGGSYQLKNNGAFPTASFLARKVIVSNHGLTWTQQDWITPVTGFPRTVSNMVDVSWPSNILEMPNTDLLSCFAMQYTGDTQVSMLLIKSTDAGASWQYVSQIGGPADVRGSDEGPDEACIERLSNGDLLCICRVVSGDQLMGWLSTDQGASWTKLGFYGNGLMRSVAPRMVTLDNGVVVVSTGRDAYPNGLSMGFATDGRGTNLSTSFKTWNLYAFHNSVAPYLYTDFTSTPGLVRKFAGPGSAGLDTTGYTGLLKIAANTVRVYYDATPQGHAAVSIWPGQIYSIDVTVSMP